MFALRSIESMPPLTWVADPWANCSSNAGCRYQAHPNYAYIRGASPTVPVVRRAPAPPRPIQLNNRVRIMREQHGVAALVELPGFSKNDIKIDVQAEQMTVAASTAPSRYYPRGATFHQSFRLGTNIDADAITASFQVGVLTVRMPYKAPKPTGPRRVIIEGPASPLRQAVSIRGPAAEKPGQPVAPPATPTAAVHQEEEAIADEAANEEERFFDFEVVAKPEAAEEPETAADANADDADLPALEDNLPEGSTQKVSNNVVDDGSIEECDY